MDRKLGRLIFPLFLAGCAQQSIPALSKQDAYDLQQAELKMKENPVGQYQLIKQTQSPDGGIQWTCLNTATGEINFAAYVPDNAEKSDFDCSH